MIYIALICIVILGFFLYRTSRKLRETEARLSRLEQSSKQQLKSTGKAHRREIQRLLDALPYPFFSIGKEGTIIRFNRHSEKILGFQEILGSTIKQIFLDSQIHSRVQKVLEKPAPFRGTLRLPPVSPFSTEAHGKDSHWEIDLRPVSLQSNDFELQLMMRDITASVHTEQVRKDFVANASHELRTPLSIIVGYLENLTEDGVLDNQKIAKEMLHTMERHVVRINRIVADMLVISKLESDDSAPLNLAPFNIADCVNDVAKRLEPVIEKQQATLEIDVPEIEIVGDYFYWTQILFNLVENALKQNALEPVTVRIDGTFKKKGPFIIHISDNGIGIPQSDLPFIFKRFFRVQKHHSQTQVKGTGLGLSIVKRAVEAHGGTIAATSTQGVKTTFSITMPHIELPAED